LLTEFIKSAIAGLHIYQKGATIMKFNGNIGFLLLGIWLILTGLSAFISMGGLAVILALLAIAAGVFILMSR